MFVDPSVILPASHPPCDPLLQCRHGNHQPEVIFRTPANAAGISEVVRWCKICGGYVVDTEGGMRMSDRTEMKTPLVAQNAFAEFSLRK